MRPTAAALVAVMLLPAGPAPPSAARADGAQVIGDRATFLSLVENRTLTRLGIRLRVGANGTIAGEAFGRPVTGVWRWDGRYFCRDLTYGGQDLGANCQVVELRGDRLRFIADEGRGQWADLRLE
jgi:hypothetical protein